jgi:hypothetical protein
MTVTTSKLVTLSIASEKAVRKSPALRCFCSVDGLSVGGESWLSNVGITFLESDGLSTRYR